MFEQQNQKNNKQWNDTTANILIAIMPGSVIISALALEGIKGVLPTLLSFAICVVIVSKIRNHFGYVTTKKTYWKILISYILFYLIIPVILLAIEDFFKI